MHYRNGREAKNGDKIVQLVMGTGRVLAAGILYDAQAGNDYCDGQVAPLPGTGACLADCLHVDDIEALLAEKGIHKRPAGK